LSYTCAQLALKIVRNQFGAMRYWIIAILTGSFKNIADEFYRWVAAPAPLGYSYTFWSLIPRMI
jgi:hypothetical protein